MELTPLPPKPTPLQSRPGATRSDLHRPLAAWLADVSPGTYLASDLLASAREREALKGLTPQLLGWFLRDQGYVNVRYRIAGGRYRAWVIPGPC